MKKLSFLFTAFLMAALTHAQSSMLATLSHEGEISTYYGANALKDAFNASQNGDVITLSSGSFNAIDITKAVTIRGNGMSADNTSGSLPTILLGDFKINIPSDVTQSLSMEGIFHNGSIEVINLSNSSFLKNRLGSIYDGGGNVSNRNKMKNISFIHCKILSSFHIYGSANCINCYIGDPYLDGTVTINNCFFYYTRDGISPRFNGTTFVNTILYTANNTLGSDVSAYNCLGYTTKGTDIFKNISNTTNHIFTNWNEIFKTYTGTYDDMENFELTEEAIKKYKGNDGTEVGIYGGSLPFSPTPSNPQITKCKVASKSTADGKLSVDIEVSASE